MWSEVNIEGNVYMSGCVVAMGKAEFTLYDCNECWRTVQSTEQMMQTVKKLNKRIRFDADTVSDTLNNAQPEIVTWAEGVDKEIVGDDKVGTEQATERLLKLKYRAGGLPFHYEWRLEKLPAAETVTLPAAQVFSVLETLPAQVDELLEVLRRKEEEIAQYKREHGTLTRSTLATKPFDLQQFHERFSTSNTKAKGLAQMLERWQAKCTNLAPLNLTPSGSSASSSPKKNFKLEDGTSSLPVSIQAAIKESPRSRKRKALMEQKLKLSRQMNSNKQKIEYESSQSQPLCDSPEQETIANEEKHKTNVVNEMEDKVKNVETKVEVESKRRKSPRLQLKFCASQVEQEIQTLITGTTKRRNTIITKSVNVASDLNSMDSKNVTTERLTVKTQEIATSSSYESPTVTDDLNVKKTTMKSTNELSLYVDSVLKAMEEFDKQLQEDLWNDVQ